MASSDSPSRKETKEKGNIFVSRIRKKKEEEEKWRGGEKSAERDKTGAERGNYE